MTFRILCVRLCLCAAWFENKWAIFERIFVWSGSWRKYNCILLKYGKVKQTLCYSSPLQWNIFIVCRRSKFTSTSESYFYEETTCLYYATLHPLQWNIFCRRFLYNEYLYNTTVFDHELWLAQIPISFIDKFSNML